MRIRDLRDPQPPTPSARHLKTNRTIHKTQMYFKSLIPRSLFLSLSLFSDLLHIRFTRRATNRSLFALWPASGIVPESSWWSGARVRIRNAKITTRDRARARVRVRVGLPAVLELIDNVLAPLCPFLCCYAQADKGERREVGAWAWAWAWLTTDSDYFVASDALI